MLSEGALQPIECPENVLFEVELEDMCEEGPSTWETLDEDEWKECNKIPGETRDSVTQELLNPSTIKEGCEEQLRLMKIIVVWVRYMRREAVRGNEGHKP